LRSHEKTGATLSSSATTSSNSTDFSSSSRTRLSRAPRVAACLVTPALARPSSRLQCGSASSLARFKSQCRRLAHMECANERPDLASDLTHTARLCVCACVCARRTQSASGACDDACTLRANGLDCGRAARCDLLRTQTTRHPHRHAVRMIRTAAALSRCCD